MVLKAGDLCILQLFQFLIYFTHNHEKINKSICQTYTWNKGAIKLFPFREYGPLTLTLTNAFRFKASQMGHNVMVSL